MDSKSAVSDKGNTQSNRKQQFYKKKAQMTENYTGLQLPTERTNFHVNRNRQKPNAKPILNDSDLCYRFPSPKKNQNVSLNHLLNFSFPERQRGFHSSSKKINYGTFNKERFVNANFRFVLEPDYDASEHLIDPDKLVRWEGVCQVIVPATEETTCPICLGPPIAPRVTKCGHIFCWPCLQHYLNLSDHSWRKCPICFDSIYSAALKNVLFVESKNYENVTPRNPQSIAFTLMKRQSNSTIVLPIMAHRKLNTNIPTVSNLSAVTFSKLIAATDEYIREMYQKDLESLESYLVGIASSSPGEQDYESSFVEICLDQIQVGEILTQQKIKDSESVTRAMPKNKTSGGDAYYFYQASDGQHLYLHPLDIKILKFEYGSYDVFPTQLTLPVISILESTVDNDIRKRCKYLSHLPLACDVNFCEVDLTDVVSIETSSNFSNEISQRLAKIQLSEQKKAQESKKAKKQDESYQRREHVSEFVGSPTFQYDENDFGPPLSTSPEYGLLTSAHSTPPNKSFAKIAMASNSHSLPSSWARSAPVEETGWKLEIPDHLLESVAQTPTGKGKKKNKIVLIGNSGARGKC